MDKDSFFSNVYRSLKHQTRIDKIIMSSSHGSCSVNIIHFLIIMIIVMAHLLLQNLCNFVSILGLLVAGDADLVSIIECICSSSRLNMKSTALWAMSWNRTYYRCLVQSTV